MNDETGEVMPPPIGGCHPVRRLATSHGVIVNARLSVASLSAERRDDEQILVRSFSLRPTLSSTTALPEW